ncbi:MAG: ATP-binding protein [Bdellovibrionales bacterium]
MRIYSLDFHQQKINVVTVDLTLMPGLPSLHLLGDVSRELREIGPKLKSALLRQGFKWPRTRQVVVDVRTPSGHVGREAELAILVALLRSTGQIENVAEAQDAYFVGEISLDGQVQAPTWLSVAEQLIQDRKIISGLGANQHFIENLAQIHQPKTKICDTTPIKWTRPALQEIWFSLQTAEFIALVAAGEHHALFAGPPGSGKTTVVECLHQLLPDLSFEQQKALLTTHQLYGETVDWRPCISPHHSSGALAILGGGTPPQPGEVTRAHGGILFLDEYLEFSPRVQEALREPLERSVIRVARGPRAALFPADFQLLAATNLCPCGNLAPGRRDSCPSSLSRCRSSVDRLSGPMLDRFQVVALSHQWQGPRTISLKQIHDQVQQAVLHRKARSQEIPNRKLTVRDLESRLVLGALDGVDLTGSERRKQSLLRVAQTLADLSGSVTIDFEHISRALTYTLHPLHELTHLFA